MYTVFELKKKVKMSMSALPLIVLIFIGFGGAKADLIWVDGSFSSIPKNAIRAGYDKPGGIVRAVYVGQ